MSKGLSRFKFKGGRWNVTQRKEETRKEMENTISFCGGELQVDLSHDCMAIEKNSHVAGILFLKDCIEVHKENSSKTIYRMFKRVLYVLSQNKLIIDTNINILCLLKN